MNATIREAVNETLGNTADVPPEGVLDGDAVAFNGASVAVVVWTDMGSVAAITPHPRVQPTSFPSICKDQ